MGIVYRAVHVDSGAKVAVKMVRSPSPKLLSALRDEMFALGRISHPGVIQVIDEGLSDGLPWYAMELLEGATLVTFNQLLWSTVVRENLRTLTTEGWSVSDVTDLGPARRGEAAQSSTVFEYAPCGPGRVLRGEVLQQVLDLYRGICSALAHIHRRGMVHRDLKPSNVFLKSGLGPVLMDFGLASRADGAIGRETLLSATGASRAGSSHYMSPEQIRGDVVDARADLYSLGCMLYESLAGHPPFGAHSAVDVLLAQLNQLPPPLTDFVDGVPPELVTLLDNLLAKQPQRRMGYAEDVDAVLAELGGALSPVYSAEADTDIPYLYRPRLAGRVEATTTIEEYLRQAEQSKGSFILIGGESGIGKTFLATEIGRRSADRKFLTLTGDCVPVASHGSIGDAQPRTGGAPFEPFRRLLQYVADRCRQQGREFADQLLGARGKILAQYEPSLAFALGQERFQDPPEMIPVAARRRVFDALTETLVRLCERDPLLWILDDLQWADELSLSFLGSHLARHVSSRRLLVVATYRSDEMTPGVSALVGNPYTKVIKLGRLDETNISALVADMLGITSVPAELIASLTKHAEGNPFFVAEYLRMAVSHGVLRRRNGRWEFAHRDESADRALAEQLPMPGSIKGLVGRRIRELDDGLRIVLLAAAVIGREVEVDLLEDLVSATSSAAIRLTDAIEALRGRQILEWIDALRVRFVHDKIREAAYDADVSFERRRALHARLAKTLELRSIWSAEQRTLFPRLAHHFESAGEPDRAADYFLRAARLARIAFANEDAINFYRASLENVTQALKRPAIPSTVRDVAISANEEMGEILSLTGSHEAAQNAYTAGLELSGPGESVRRARLHRLMGKAQTGLAKHAAALQTYTAAESILSVDTHDTPPESWREWVEIQTEKIWSHYWLGDTDALGLAIERLAPVVERHGSPAQRANFYQASCLSALRRDRYHVSATTIALIRSAARDARDSATPVEAASVRFIYAFALIFFGGIEDARVEMQQVLLAANRLGDPLLKVRTLAYLSMIHRQLGDANRAREVALETIDLAASLNAFHYLGTGQATLGWTWYSIGLIEDAERSLRAALASWAKASTVYPFQDLALWPLVSLLAETGRGMEAVSHLRSLIDPTQRRFSDELDSELREFFLTIDAGQAPSAEDLKNILSRARTEALY